VKEESCLNSTRKRRRKVNRRGRQIREKDKLERKAKGGEIAV
jgi:hypothetical protein